MELSIIIPCYEEEQNLRILLPELHLQLRAADIAYEVIVVDTALPRDNSRQVCLEHGAIYVNQKEDGFGGAIRSGIAAVTGRYLLVMDGDCTHPPSFVPQLLFYRQDYDIVAASRYMQGGASGVSPIMASMSRLLNLVYGVTLGLRIKDVSNGMKLYRSADVKSLSLSCRYFDITEEIFYKVIKSRKGVTVKEVPFAQGNRIHGTSKRAYILFIYSYIKTLLKLRLGT